MNRIVRTTLVLVCVVAVSCAKKENAQTERPHSTATISVVEPKAGDVISGKTMTVRLRLTGGRIVQVVSQDLTRDEGHVHVSVDGKILTQTFGLTQKLKTPKPGTHLLQAEFVAKDHGPFMPRVLSTVTFTVKS
jgi:hypothetical protein